MSPEEDRTRDAVDSEPKHYQLSYCGPTARNKLNITCNQSLSGMGLLLCFSLFMLHFQEKHSSLLLA